MSESKPTCGPLYKAALQKYTGGDAEKIRLFAAGFVSGQAEKVYLGACNGAMFRPSREYQRMVLDIAQDVAVRYSLTVRQLGEEIWIVHRAANGLFDSLRRERPNSSGWHWLRGRICGVPDAEIDDRFHLRPGAGERCD